MRILTTVSAKLLVMMVALSPVAAVAASLAERSGATFVAAPADPYQAPRGRVIPLPDFPGAHAVWGATGRDRRGHVWVGVSAEGGDHSAHLMEYDPVKDRVFDRGDVVSQLKAAGLHKPGERQVKIHSRIIEGEDGYLYFASTDEQGEGPKSGTPPKWGSHLWRLRPGEDHWQHLHWVQEGLTAIASGGRWIYALGLWDHVLYQYDTESGALNRVVVGSQPGHMSRNLIADQRGHVYVPRLERPSADADDLEVTLVEFDSDLNEVGETPIEGYAGAQKPQKSHGITGLAYLADGSMAFSTHMGRLYRITPRDGGPAEVASLGYLHPGGESYAPSLFTFAGERYLAGVVRYRKNKNKHHSWVVYDLESRSSRLVEGPFDDTLLIYGSITRDAAGRFYVVGRHKLENRQRSPMLLQLDVAP